MPKFRLFLVPVFTVCYVSAQSDFLWAESQQPRRLLLDLYASLYTNPAGQMPLHTYSFRSVAQARLTQDRRLTDTLIFLDRLYIAHAPYGEPDAFDADRLSRLVAEDGIPQYDDTAVLAHLRTLYTLRNRDNPVFRIQAEDARLFTAFLSVADRVDGSYDGRLGLPNLEQFYTLLVTRKVPLPAICYNCREERQWADRRGLLRAERLERDLPRGLRKLRKSKADAERRLAEITLFIAKNIVASEDGWAVDYWQTPEETLLVQEGDCEDFAILFYALAEYLEVPVQVVVGDIEIDKDGRRQTLGHAWVEYGGRVIDPIMADHRGPIAYKGQFRFNKQTASLTLPPAAPAFDNRVAGR